MILLDGKKVAEEIYKKLEKKVENLEKTPKLTAVLVGEDPASLIYLNRKEKAARRLGISFELIKLVSTTPQSELEQLVNKLNSDNTSDGIVIQKPLPSQINSDEIDLLVAPEKDVDGLRPDSAFVPATARGVVELLEYYKIRIDGKRAVIIGTSNLTGKPTGIELKKKGASVTFCDDKTQDLASKTSEADILVVAVGNPKLITVDMVKKGVVVVDIGINRLLSSPKLVGDVDFEEVSKIASYITPVPGGVGPMTVAAVMENLMDISTHSN